MVLAVDIGNSNIVIGIFNESKILFTDRILTEKVMNESWYIEKMKATLKAHEISEKDIEGAILSSVVPELTTVFENVIYRLFGIKAVTVGLNIKTDLSIKSDDPAELGSDLIVGAVAGIEAYSSPLIIIDMGTATTFSVVDRQKNLIGVSICTGMAISAKALIGNTSQLRGFSFEKPQRVIGTNTVDCLKSGIIYGHAAMIDGIVERMEEELGYKTTVVATGGLASLVVPLCKKEIILDDDLLLKGLITIYNKNK